MRFFRLSVVLALLALIGCRTGGEPLEGSFVPACTAFAGDRMSFREGQYSWNKFTDERRIGPDGEPVDPYPDFPKTGDFELDGDAVRLLQEDGSVLASWYPHDRAGQLLLLNQSQQDAWSASGTYPDCPLALEQSQ